MKTKTIEIPQEEFLQRKRQWKQFWADPKRFDYIIDKMVPFMVSEPENLIEKFKETFGEESDLVEDYKEYIKADKEYFKIRLREKYEQYLYCFFPDKYEEYVHRKTIEEIKEEKNDAMYSRNNRYNDRNYTFLG